MTAGTKHQRFSCLLFNIVVVVVVALVVTPDSGNTRVTGLSSPWHGTSQRRNRVELSSDDAAPLLAQQEQQSQAWEDMVQLQQQQVSMTMNRQLEQAVIASSFETSSFTTFDPLLKNNHAQTILGGYFLRDTTAAFVPKNNPAVAYQRIWQGVQQKLNPWDKTKNTKTDFWDIRQRIVVDNGRDWFHADTKYFGPKAGKQQQKRQKHLILIHGLESNSNSTLVRQIATAAGKAGGGGGTMDVVTCLNFRSCSMDGNGKCIPNLTPAGYHLGFTDDLIHYLKLLKTQSEEQGIPMQDIYLAGFSLGANVVLKALGELGLRAMDDYNIKGAAVACAPLDQEANAIALAQPGINRIVYTNTLLKSLKAKALEQYYTFCKPEIERNGSKQDPADVAAIANYQKGLLAITADWAGQVANATRIQLTSDQSLERIQEQIATSWLTLTEYWYDCLVVNQHAAAAKENTKISLPWIATAPVFIKHGILNVAAPVWNQSWNFWTTDFGQTQSGVAESTILTAAIGTSLLAAPYCGFGHQNEILASGLFGAFLAIRKGPLGTAIRIVSEVIQAALCIGKEFVNQAILLQQREEEQVMNQLLRLVPAQEEEQDELLTMVNGNSVVRSSSSTTTLVQSDDDTPTTAFAVVVVADPAKEKSKTGKLFDLSCALGAKTITEFDDAFIAPIYGFKDCWDYYRKTSSLYYLENIVVPTLLLNAQDDPFFHPTKFPIEKTVEGGGRAPIKMVRTPHGGHLGFSFAQVDDDSELLKTTSMSWMPMELARFLKHVQDNQPKAHA